MSTYPPDEHSLGASFVAVVETADFRDHDDGSAGCLSGRPAIGRVFLECEVRSAPVIGPEVGREHAPEMRLVQDDHVIEALPADRADHALDIRILPGTRRRGHDFGDAHASHAALEHGAIDAISIAVEPAGCRVVRKGVDHLLRGPLGRGMCRDVQMHDTTAMVAQHHHTNSTRPVSVGTVKKSIDAADAR